MASTSEQVELDIDPSLQSIKNFHLLARKAESKEVIQCMIRENDMATSSSLESLEEERKRSEKLLEELKNIRIEELNEEKLNQLLDELLKRKEESFVDEEASLQQNYLMREASLKPPEPGTIEVKTMIEFPPKEVDLSMLKVGEMLANEKREEIQQQQTLKIVRALPTGNQPSELHSVPFLSITFNQDMIEEFDAETKSFEEIDFIEIRPVTENLRKGKWKWIGTKSLLFQPYFRFDRSTEFTYTVLKSKTKSAFGLGLEDDYRVTFKTQTMRVEEFVPPHHFTSFPISHLPFCYMKFDQSVDRNEVTKGVKITCGSKPINFEVLQDTSIIAQTLKDTEFEKKFPSVYHTYNDLLTKNKTPTSRFVWLHLLVDNNTIHAGKGYPKLEVGQNLYVAVPEGMKSLEGPLLSTHSFNSTIHGFGSMRITNHEPKKYSYYNSITPGCSFTFETSNPIDLDQVHEKEKFVTVHPAIENCSISVGIHRITISGNTLARENYSVTIHKGLPDIYGQVLEKDYVATFEVSGESKRFNNSLPNITILPPSLFDNYDPFIYFDCVNISETLTVINQVDPEFMAREVCYPKYYKSFFSSYPSYEYFKWVTKKQRTFGTIVYNEKVKPNDYVKDRSVSSTISLAPYLQNSTQKLATCSSK
ncbi:hypothetical protein C9374_007061 [Naegleria lovaniensis]|uniref:Uncharacterized protein n=1 Tax=Naegleria lovaniensis TaxID=51637 RepID=A0AA88GYZ4_NAELO|nr:uncharacterized protein C9374_007061 [Naegleria lovaniensis]KAG2393530.1 hypothetical protein C9374_007061 [Naegleria lovaniensis]